MLLIAIEQGLGRLQFEDFNVRAQRPPMRGGSVKQLSFSLRERDVEIALTRARAFQKKLEGDRCFARARLAFDEEKTTPGKTT